MRLELDAIRHAANAVKAGEGDAYVAAGSSGSAATTSAPSPGAADQNPKLQGGDGQPNAYIEMGLTAVNVAKKYEVSRADMDKYAQRSQELAVASQETGFFDREIVPVADQDGNEVAKDDGPRPSSTLEKLSQLEEAFGGGGVTAGNSCPLNDGAAAVLVMSDTARRSSAWSRRRGSSAPRPGATSRVHGRRPDRRDRRCSSAPGCRCPTSTSSSSTRPSPRR